MKRFFLIYIAFLSAIFQAYPAKQDSAIPDELMNSLLKYAKVCQIIEQNYVDSVNYDTLCTNAIVGMLKKLDPHSSYLTPKQVRASNEVLRSGFDGIGISYNMIDDTLNIIQVIPEGPSERAGLEVGDKILYADTVCIAGRGLSNDDIQKHIRGKSGTVLELRLLRGKEVVNKRVKRGHIPINSVTSSYIVAPGVGYIMIERFAEHTVQEFENALKTLEKGGAKSLILDLRGNGGGYLLSAINLLSHFLPAGTPLLRTEGLHRQTDVRFSRLGYQMFTDKPLAVLIDGHSASASEITAGALQDCDRGVIIGSRSYGKGLVQQPYQLPDSSEVRVTIARYLTPSGRSVQKPYKDGVYLKTDTGGIYPDVYIAPDTAKMTAFQKAVIKKQVLVRTSLKYYLKNKELLNKFSNVDSFYSGVDMKPVYDVLNGELSSVGIDYSPDEMEESMQMFSRYLKALVARCIWGNGAYYESLNIESEEVKAAIDILGDSEKYHSILSINRK